MSAASQRFHSLYVWFKLSPSWSYPLSPAQPPTAHTLYLTPALSGSPAGRCSTPRDHLLNSHVACLYFYTFNLGRGLYPGNWEHRPQGQPRNPSPSHTAAWWTPPVSLAPAISTPKESVISSLSQLCLHMSPLHGPLSPDSINLTHFISTK